MDFSQLLDSKSFIESWEVIDDRIWDTGHYYKIRVDIKPNTMLQATEYKDLIECSYSFHWQNSKGELIIRWDNAPHYKNLSNYPHHKHLPNKVVESVEMTLEKVLSEIESML